VEDIARAHDPGVLCQRLEDVSLLPSRHGAGIPEHARIVEDGESVVCMYVGNLEGYQGIDLLLHAFALAAGRDTRLRLVIIGGSDEDIRHYRQKSTAMGLNGRVRFVGRRPVTDLHHYLAQADILVSPRCRGINTPMKIYSYLDSGTAVLATAIPTHTQVLDPEIACLAEPTPGAMAEGLLRLSADSGLRQGLGERARERVRLEHSREAFQRKLGEFYSRLEKEIIHHREGSKR
jgi:glycosyltransferase involved in cell wall biosynthesis